MPQWTFFQIRKGSKYHVHICKKSIATAPNKSPLRTSIFSSLSSSNRTLLIGSHWTNFIHLTEWYEPGNGADCLMRSNSHILFLLLVQFLVNVHYPYLNLIRMPTSSTFFLPNCLTTCKIGYFFSLPSTQLQLIVCVRNDVKAYSLKRALPLAQCFVMIWRT